MCKKIANRAVLLVQFALLAYCLSCQNLQEYHDCLIETSLISEIPTLLGNCAGAVVGVPFLAITVPIAYVSSTTSTSQAIQTDTVLWPIKITSYSVGIVTGTPFYPFAYAFPREQPTKQLHEEQPASQSREQPASQSREQPASQSREQPASQS